MNVNTETFDLLLRRSGLNQRELADRARVSAKTISRVRGGAGQNRSTIEKIAKALGVSAEVLTSPPAQNEANETEAALKGAGYRRLSTYISGRRALQFALVEERYDIKPRDLIEAAPLLFTLLAEMSLKARRDRLEAFEVARGEVMAKAPRHLHGAARADMDFAAASVCEENSIASADIRGRDIYEMDEAFDETDLFAAFLAELAAGLDPQRVGDVDGVADGLEYDILADVLADYTNSDPLAEFALTAGHARLRDVPEQLVGDPEACAEWLRARVPEAARLEREEQLRFVGGIIDSVTGAPRDGQGPRDE